MQRNRVFGGRCCESLASFDRELSSWKTYQISFDWGDSTFSDPLPQSGIMQNGQLYPLECLEHLISEKDGFASAILPTPTATANQAAPSFRKHWKGILPTPTADQRVQRYAQGGRSTLCAIVEMLPTPTATDPDKQSTGGLHRRIVLGQKYSKGDHRYKDLPTPTAHLYKEQGSPAEFKRKSQTLICRFIDPDMDIGERPRLSPHFVTWMMGFPIDWLD